MKDYFLKMVILVSIFLLHNNVKAENYPFKVRKSGSGVQSIIFIPGFASSGDVWDETAARYQNKYTCYVLTMAGFAGVKAVSNPSFAGWENAIAAYIKENNINRPVIIGHSMGGALAMALAADCPELIEKIVVADALPCLAALTNPSFKANANNDCSAIVKQITTMPNDYFKQMQEKSISGLLQDTSKQKKVLEWSINSDRNTFASVYCDFLNIDLRQKINNIRCANLVMLESSFVNYKTQIEDQFKTWPNANLQYADKGLHFIMFDDSNWYFKQLDSFLQ